MENETIAAIATSEGVASISVIRISGDKSIAIADKVFKSNSHQSLIAMKGYTASFGKVYKEGNLLDEAVAIVFKAPKSYTGEDVVEICCHGGIFVTRQVLNSLIISGAAPAGPGEFTKRAFLNGKVDLTKAESVMNLISARGNQALNAAVVSCKGEIYKGLKNIKKKLTDLCAKFFVSVDYEELEEDVDLRELESTLSFIEEELENLVLNYEKGKIIREGIRVAIIGCPNVGKSSLMNFLLGFERSIVTNIAGTTRDIIEESIIINGIVVNLLDTAGIRETSDPIEEIGVKKAKEEQKQADLILVIFDSSRPLSDEDLKIIDSLKDGLVLAIINKIDLPCELDKNLIRFKFKNVLEISFVSNYNVELIKENIFKVLSISNFDSNQGFLANQRQFSAANSALSLIKKAKTDLKSSVAIDMVFLSIEESAQKIGELTGENIKDSVIDEIFSKFCVGK